MTTRYLLTLEEKHVGRAFIQLDGRPRAVTDWIGRILPNDVGKRVYDVDGVIQVENDEQRAARLARSNPPANLGRDRGRGITVGDTVRPLVVVIENPQEDPTVYSLGDVEIIEFSSYPLSRFPGNDEYGLDDYEDMATRFAAAAARFPADHPAHRDLTEMAKKARKLAYEGEDG